MTAPVAFVCEDPGIAPDGTKGASVHFRSLARAFADVGVSLDVLMARDGAVDGFAPHRAQVVATPRHSGLAGEVHQLAHSVAMHAALAGNGPHAAVYERLSLFGLAGLLHSRSLGVPLLVEVNAPLWCEAAMFRDLRLQKAAQGVCLDVCSGASYVLPVSTVLADELMSWGIDHRSIEVIGNGADLEAFRGAQPAPRPARFHGRPTLMFVGSLKPWHGIGFLLEAFRALRQRRDCALWVIGDGPERSLVHQAQAHMREDIAHTPHLSHEEVPAALQAADIVVAPYTTEAPAYFSPLKVVEVLAAGRPLLASRVPCVMSTVAGHSLPGLFEADEVGDFVATAERLLDAGESAALEGVDPDLIERLDWRVKARHLAELMGQSASAAHPVEQGGGRG